MGCWFFPCCLVAVKSESVRRSVLSDSLRPHGLSMEFSRQEYWNGLSFPSPGLIKPLTGDIEAADWCLSRGSIGAFQSAEWAVVQQLRGANQAADTQGHSRAERAPLSVMRV